MRQSSDADSLAACPAEIEALGPVPRLHATVLCSALDKKDQMEAAAAAELVQVLENLLGTMTSVPFYG